MSLVPIIKYDALDVSSVNLSKMDGTDKVPVIITLEAAVISNLRNLYPNENLNEEINFIINQKMFQPKPELKYKGKTKIRSDVLQKLKNISNLMENSIVYPNFKLQQIKVMVKDVLGDSDSRVFHEFLKTINGCIYSCSGTKLSLYNSVDCTCFIKIVNEKLMEKYY